MRLMKDNVERIAENEAQIAKLKQMGFHELMDQDKGDAPVNLPGQPDGKKSLGEMSVTELKALAKEKGIEGAGSLNKEELLAVLKDVV